MAYPEPFIAPMRAELTCLGVRELRTSADVDAAVASPGVTMIVVNSVCGCAAGKARAEAQQIARVEIEVLVILLKRAGVSAEFFPDALT